MASKTMETAEKIMQQIAAHPADHTVRRNFAIAVGQAIHQGDVYLVRVEPTHPKGKLLGTRQIALGNSIGSRHIVRGDIEVYEGVDFPPVMLEDCKERERLGPRLVWRSGTLTHPEHANFTDRKSVV